LNEADRKAYIQRYEGRLREFGYSPEALGWGAHGRQPVRFGVLAEPALRRPQGTVLDVGCGFADLYDFLGEHGWHGQYTGIDIVPGLLAEARKRHPDLDLREADITADAASLPACDFVLASGVFNAALAKADNETHIQTALRAMFGLARVAVTVDFMSSYVDFQKPGSWHTDPGQALAWAKKISRRVALRHDYMPYEFALFIYADDTVSEQNVFCGHEILLPQ
jgi:ubiquinone/menaquinone biosynthesis C-methylase UbiE